MPAARKLSILSSHEYLSLKRASEHCHEFVNGDMVAMTGAKRVHVAIAGNIYYALRGLIPCSSSKCYPTQRPA